MQSCTSEAPRCSIPASAWDAGEDGWPWRELLAPDFRVQRRNVSRWPVAGTATLLALGSGLGTLVELHALEGAPWWLSGRASTPIEPGTRVSVGFSDPDGRPAAGVVVRCRASSDGNRPLGGDGATYCVAVRFDGEQIL